MLETFVDPLPRSPTPICFEPGVLLGGKYRIVAAAGRGAYGELYSATDARGAEVSVRRIRTELLGVTAGRGRLHAEIVRAATLEHAGIVKPLDFLEIDGEVAIVSQPVRGTSLRTLLAARPGPQLLTDSVAIVLNLCTILAHAAPITFHGGIHPSNVIVQSGGRIRLADWGLARALPLVPALLESSDRPYLAPELASTADGRSDLFALGALLFELVTGRSPGPDTLPRQVNPDLPVDLDVIVACLLAANPDDRLADVATLAKALERMISSEEATARAQRSAEAARVSKELAVHQERKQPAPKRIRIDESEPRWLIHKGKVDYGPYTLAEIKRKIAAHEVVPGDIVIDHELGKRAEVEAHPLLHTLVLEASHVRQADNEAQVVRTDKQRGRALSAIIAFGAVVLLGGGFLIVRAMRTGDPATSHREDSLALEGAGLGGLRIGSARHVDDREAQRHRRPASAGPRPSTPSAGGKGGDSFDDAMSFDMMDDRVGDERLDDTQINAVIGKHARGLADCLTAEAGRGGTRRAEIDFVILGSGKVAQARVNGESSSALAVCVRGALQSMAFPSFNGPRTKASFSMGL